MSNFRKTLFVFVLPWLVACASKPVSLAPVESKNINTLPTQKSSVPSSTTIAPKPAQPGVGTSSSITDANVIARVPEGYYQVQPGDTLLKISRDFNVTMKDLQFWNSLRDPNLIYPGQVLRVHLLPGEKGRVQPVVKPAITVVPIQGATSPNVTSVQQPQQSSPLAATSSPPPSKGVEVSKINSAKGIVWSWPHAGDLSATFNKTTRGIDIKGQKGDAILAVADGRVSVAGVVLPGYGQLVLIRHSDSLLTAYAHLDSVSVSQDQVVRRGQEIGKMGNSGSDSVKLHLELRENGEPTDPLTVLPH